MLKITFLGTGTSYGVPVLTSKHPVCLSNDSKDKRLRSSVLVQWAETNIVIDCGPDFRQQLLRENLCHLDAILFTHEHADHTAGLDDIRAFNHKRGPLPIYGSKRVLKSLKQRYQYIFQNESRYQGVPKVLPHRIVDGNPFEIEGKTILPVKVNHTVMPVMGFRIDNFAYFTDVKTIPQKKYKYLTDLDVLVLNCIRKESHPNHLNLEEAISIVRLLAPKKCYFTHISNQMGFHEVVSKELPKNIQLAYDTLQVESA